MCPKVCGNGGRGDGGCVVSPANVAGMFESLFAALNDYTTDSHGDIGAVSVVDLFLVYF